MREGDPFSSYLCQHCAYHSLTQEGIPEMWEACLLPHPHMMIAISSKRLMGKQAKARHRFDGSESKVLESLGECKSRKAEPPTSEFIAWLHGSLPAEAAGFRILHGRYQIGLCIPHSRSLLPPLYPAAHSVQMASSSAWKAPLTVGTLGLSDAQGLYPLGLCGHWEARRPVSGVVASLLPGLPHIPEGAHLGCSRGCRPGVAQDPSDFRVHPLPPQRGRQSCSSDC